MPVNLAVDIDPMEAHLVSNCLKTQLPIGGELGGICWPSTSETPCDTQTSSRRTQKKRLGIFVDENGRGARKQPCDREEETRCYFNMNILKIFSYFTMNIFSYFHMNI